MVGCRELLVDCLAHLLRDVAMQAVDRSVRPEHTAEAAIQGLDEVSPHSR